MKKALIILFACTFYFSHLFAQSPGGVSTNLRWWMKANAGTFTDNGTTPATEGQLVQQWNDQSAIANHARQTTNANKPEYRTNVINSNPVLRFASNQFLDGLAAPGIGPTESFYMFLIFRQNSYTAGGTNDGNGTFIIDRPTATQNLTSFKIVNTDKYMYQKRTDGGANLGGPVSITSAPTNRFTIIDYFREVNVSFGIYIDGRLDVTAGGDNTNITGPIIRIGRHATTVNGGLNGDFAEMVVYNTNLSTADRQKVESYLAIKYGITLNQTVARNYVNSAGTVVYPAATTHDDYDFDIAGIARDDGSALNQTSSQSQNPLSMVRIFNPSSLDDGDFLMWGHNAPTIWNSNNVPAPYTNRLTRVWRVAETGEVGTFSISFDLTGLGVDMTDPNQFALLVDNDGNFSDASVHTTGRTISGNVVTFTGASINTNQYFSLASAPVPGPGGVAGTTIWLRADEDVYVNAGTTLATNGQTVQQWNTRGGITGANATQATAGNRPTFFTNIANGNPVVRFATTRFLNFGALGVGSTSNLAMSAVFRPATNNGGTIGNTTGGYIVDRTSATTPVVSLKILSNNKVGFQQRVDSNPPLGGPVTTSDFSTTTPQIIDYFRDYAIRFGIAYNGQLEDIQAEAGGALTFPTLRIGAREGGANGLDGDIAEFIFYTRSLTTGERNRIDSYLAIKYGITLNQTTLTNYTASNGTTVYPATSTHSGYVSNIAGIGRDNVSRLLQTNSQSANPNSMVRIQNPSNLDNLEFLMWGSNNGSLTTPNSIDVDGTLIEVRLSRIWKIAETGEVGTVTISVDLANVPGPKQEADLRLLIDRDGDGFADNDVTPLTGTLAGSVFTVTGVNFQHNDLFTIGSVNNVSTPLPVELLYFKAEYERPVVVTSWATATELNNDFFTLERSSNGEHFEELAIIPGAGTTNERNNYFEIDPSPYYGKTYYRLKQTDFDGTVTYSNIVHVKTDDDPSMVLTVYPNPNKGKVLNFSLNDKSFQLHNIEVYNQQGITLESQVIQSPSVVVYTAELKSELQPGIYFIKVQYNDTVKTVKLIVN